MISLPIPFFFFFCLRYLPFFFSFSFCCIPSMQRGEWLKLILSFAESPDQAIRFGVLQIIRNLTTSEDDLNQEFNDVSRMDRRSSFSVSTLHLVAR